MRLLQRKELLRKLSGHIPVLPETGPTAQRLPLSLQTPRNPALQQLRSSTNRTPLDLRDHGMGA